MHGGIVVHFFVLFPFHASVLEPDFHLFFREIQHSGDLYSSKSREVSVVEEFFLQFEELDARVSGTDSFRLAAQAGLLLVLLLLLQLQAAVLHLAN